MANHLLRVHNMRPPGVKPAQFSNHEDKNGPSKKLLRTREEEDIDIHTLPKRRKCNVSDMPLGDRVAMACATSAIVFNTFDNKYHRSITSKVFTRKKTSLAVNSLYARGDAWLMQILHGKNCALTIDGGRDASRIDWLNVMVHCSGTVYFLTRAKYVSKKPEIMAGLIMRVIARLASNKTNVISITADNDSSLRSSLDIVHEKAPHIAVVRCACHSLQLLMKDITDKCAAVLEGILSMREVLSFYRCKENKMSLASALMARGQKAMSLLQLSATRWSSVVLVLERILLLKDGIFDTMHITQSQWKSMEFAYAVLLPLKIATNILQKDSANFFDAVRALQRIQTHFTSSLENFNLMKHKESLQKAHALMKDRITSNFSFAAWRVASFLSLECKPSSGVIEEITDFVHEVTGVDPSQENVDEIESYLSLSGKVMFASSDAWKSFWDGNAVKYSFAYRCVEMLNLIPVSEAAVERSFSAEKYMCSPRRNRLGPRSVMALLFLRINRDMIEMCHPGLNGLI